MTTTRVVNDPDAPAEVTAASLFSLLNTSRIQAGAPSAYATPAAGYANRRPNPAPVPTGSAKVSATASHSSGDFTPRARMWSFASSFNRELESYV